MRRGATQDNLGLDKILSFPILAPEVNGQRRIGAILSAYDELMENSQRRIRIVEAIAHVEAFLLELGAGFALVGRQLHLEVGDRDFYLDLLFYHPCATGEAHPAEQDPGGFRRAV